MANRRNEYQILLEMANEELAESNTRLELYKNEDGFYNLDIIHPNGKRENYAENYFEDELDGLVHEAWHDAANA